MTVCWEGEPQICGFGIAEIVEESATSGTASAGIVRYSAPELIGNYDSLATTNSNTYSFAMLIFECITEQIPFSNLSHDAAIIYARINMGQFPSRPDGTDPKN